MSTITIRTCAFCPRSEAVDLARWGTVHVVTPQNEAKVHDICPVCIASKLHGWTP